MSRDPQDHPQRRRDDGVTLYSSKERVGTQLGTRPVEFTRPMSVVDARERAAALNRVNQRTSRWHRAMAAGLRVIAWALAGLAVVGVLLAAVWRWIG